MEARKGGLDQHRFALGVGAAAGIGLLGRLLYLYLTRGWELLGDGYAYHIEAQRLADGTVQGPLHPPAWTFVMAVPLMTLAQVEAVAAALGGGPPAVVSVFAGRIADAGTDPVPVMRAARRLLDGHGDLELLWASPREVLNVVQADESGCDIITMTSDVYAKLSSLGRDLDDFSLATVQMFRDDAVAAAYEF